MTRTPAANTKRQANFVTQVVKPDAILAMIVGRDPLPRSEIVKLVWDYIKLYDLQEPTNRRQINADETLRPLFDGKEHISMFGLMAYINAHVTKVGAT